MVALLGALAVGRAQTPPVAGDGPATQGTGLIRNDPGAYQGYTLLSPLSSQSTYLIDMAGRVVNEWNAGSTPSSIAYLLENGHLLRAGNLKTLGVWAEGRGAGGRIEQLDWDGKQVWKYDVADDNAMQHHDIEPLPNGNVLILAWERKTGAEALAAGRHPKLLSSKELWPEKIIEYSPASGTVVWEWHDTTFVEYLRVAFRWGGFPGWQRLDLGQLSGTHLPESVRPAEHLAYLSADLQPL